MRYKLFRDGLKQLRASQEPMYFFLCEQAENGKPFIFTDTSKIDLKKDPLVLKTLEVANIKRCITGVMEVKANTLHVMPIGNTLSASVVEKSTLKAAHDAGDHEIAISVGLRQKDKGSEFEGEDVKKGFRTADPAHVDDTDYVTEYDKDPSTSKSRVEGGLLKDAKGAAVDGKKGFVIDPKTGHVHLFDQQVEVEEIATGKRRVALADDMPPNPIKPGTRLVTSHHSTPLAGGAVAGAGEVHGTQGKVTKIADQSGHYKPEAHLTHQAVEAMKKGGVKLVDDELLQDGGKPATPEQQKAYALVRAYREQMKVPPNGSLAETAKVLATKSQRNAQMEKMAELEASLRKAGVGPSHVQAAVELGGKGLTQEEFAQVQGNRDAINALMFKKYSVKEVLHPGIDPPILQSLLKLNNELRKNMAKVTLGAETFLQTDGGEKAIRQKSDLKTEITGSNVQAGTVITDKLWKRIAGNRDEINKELRKHIGKEDFLPPDTKDDVLNNRAMINLLIAKGAAALAKVPVGGGLVQPGKAQPKARVQELMDELKVKFAADEDGQVDTGMPETYKYSLIAEDAADVADKFGKPEIAGWMRNGRVETYADLADELGLEVEAIYEKLTGKKA